jgi:phage-related protein
VIMAGFNAAKTVVTTVLNAVKATVRAVWAAILAVIRTYINGIKATINGVRSVIAVVKNAFSSAKSAAAAQISALVSLVKGLPRRVSGALGNLGRLLYDKGQALVRGFINGIASMLGAVKAKARSVVKAVTDFLPGSPAKEGPLSGKGYVLLRARRFMDDFAQGMQDGSQKPVAALMGAVNPISRAVVPGTSQSSSGAWTTTAPTDPGARATRVYHVAIGDKKFADLVVDAVTGEPMAVSKATSEGARRSAWAGNGR